MYRGKDAGIPDFSSKIIQSRGQKNDILKYWNLKTKNPLSTQNFMHRKML